MEMVLLEASQIRTRQTNEVNVMRIDWRRKGDQDAVQVPGFLSKQYYQLWKFPYTSWVKYVVRQYGF